MVIERMVNFHVDYKKPWAQYSAAMMGIFVFFRALWFFVSPQPDALTDKDIWMHMILPLAVGIVYLAVFWGVRVKHPVVYGGIGSVFCVLMIMLNLQTGNSFWVVFSVVWYILADLVLIATVLGFLPNCLFLLAAFAVPVVLQYFINGVGYYLTHFSVAQITMLLREASNLFGVAAFAFLSLSLVGKKRSEK